MWSFPSGSESSRKATGCWHPTWVMVVSLLADVSLAAQGPTELRVGFDKGQTFSYLVVQERQNGIGVVAKPRKVMQCRIDSFSCISHTAVEGERAFELKVMSLPLDSEHVLPAHWSGEPMFVKSTGEVFLRGDRSLRLLGRDTPFVPELLNQGIGFPTFPLTPVSVGDGWRVKSRILLANPPVSLTPEVENRLTVDLQVSCRLRRIHRARFAPTHRLLEPLAVIQYGGKVSTTITNDHVRGLFRDVTISCSVTGTAYFSTKIHQVVKIVQEIRKEESTEGKPSRTSVWCLSKVLITNPHIDIKTDGSHDAKRR